MANPPVTKEQANDALRAYIACHGIKTDAARMLKLPRSTYASRLLALPRFGLTLPVIAPVAAPDFPEELSQIQELRQKVKLLTEANRHLTDQLGNLEHVKALIHDLKRYTPAPPAWLRQTGIAHTTGTPVLVGSDWHWGELVRSAELGGVNAYNKDIAARRAETFFKKAVELLTVQMAHPSYDGIVLALLGDMLSGTIHQELSENSWAPINVCILELADVLIAGCELLLQHFPKVYVPCVVGNHGRHHVKPRFKHKQHDNYEWIMYHLVARHFKHNPNITFDIADASNLPFQLYNTTFMCNHGDDMKGGGGISGSWSPISRGDAKKRKQHMALQKPYQWLLIGHWHFKQVLPGVRCNGSLKGFDEYAMALGCDYQLPMQDLFIVHPQYGITCEWGIYCEQPGTTFHLRTDTPQLPNSK